jgi:hypothetical protein
MLRCVRRPSLANDVLLLGMIALASAARLQLVVLVPAALTAIVIVALLRGPRPEPSRKTAVLHAVSQHRLLFGVVAAGLAAGLARTAMNGGSLPLAGRYANVGTAHASPLRVIELFFQHLAELDFAVGVIPFAAALLTGYALVRAGFPRRALIFASVAAASTFWILLEVAADAAAFDATSPHAAGPATDLPRIHERYLIYVMPFFLIALVAALPFLRKRISRGPHIVVATVAALLPALIPFGTVINSTTGIDSFALQMFGTTRAGHPAPIPNATTLILALSILLAVVYLIAVTQPFPSMAVVATVVALLWMTNLELGGQAATISWRSLGVPAHPDWVDRVVGTHSDVRLVGGDGVQPGTLHETAFFNRSVTRVYSTCYEAFGAAFGEQPVPAGGIATRYAVVPAAWNVAGHVLARNLPGKLVLVAPSGGTLSVPVSPCRR